MDRDTAYLVALELDFSRMNPSAGGEAVVGGGIDHGRGPPHRSSRGVEENEEAVAGGLRLTSAKALDFGTHRLVVLGKQQPPPSVAEPRQHLCRTAQVREDQGRKDAVRDLTRRLRKEPAASPVDRDPRLIPDDPRVVPRRDLEGIAAHHIQRRAVGHFDV